MPKDKMFKHIKKHKQNTKNLNYYFIYATILMLEFVRICYKRYSFTTYTDNKKECLFWKYFIFWDILLC